MKGVGWWGVGKEFLKGDIARISAFQSAWQLRAIVENEM
jgi:hypothetical protein